jgi:predicted RND superfamily exporter protein
MIISTYDMFILMACLGALIVYVLLVWFDKGDQK